MVDVCLKNIGLIPYKQAWQLQKDLVKQKLDGLAMDTIIIVEHPSVYTIGRRGNPKDILISKEKLKKLGIEILNVDRGGEVTYHGPGQLTVYPILDLKRRALGAADYIHSLEKVIVATLNHANIDGEVDKSFPGVWVKQRKIASIGVRISRGITMHGFSLNISPDLSHFDHIIPCGIKGKRTTSITNELGRTMPTAQVSPWIIDAFSDIFDSSIISSPKNTVTSHS